MENKYSAKGALIAILKCFLFFALYILVQAASISLMSILLSATAPEKLDFFSQMSVEITIISGCITILIFALLAKVLKSSLSEMAYLTKMNPRFIISVIIMGACVAYIVAIVLNSLEMLDLIPDSWIKTQSKTYEDVNSASPILQLLCVGIVAPLLEEILFRGFMLGTLKKEMHPWIAICLSALFFGLAHGTPIGIIYATGLGIVMGWLFVKFNSILPSLLFHIAYNLTVSFAQGLSIFTLILPLPILILEIVDINKYFRGKQK